MFACCGLTGLEPRKKPTGGIFIVLVFVHQVFKIISKNTALKSKRAGKGD
jgi:hypothetical protein